MLARHYLEPLLKHCGIRPKAAGIAVKLAPMLVVLGGLAIAWSLQLQARGVALAGEVPSGLPQLNLAMSHGHWRALVQPFLPYVFVIVVLMCAACASVVLALNRMVFGRALHS